MGGRVYTKEVKKSRTFNTRVSEEFYEYLTLIAEKDDRTRANLIIQAVAEYGKTWYGIEYQSKNPYESYTKYNDPDYKKEYYLKQKAKWENGKQ